MSSGGGVCVGGDGRREGGEGREGHWGEYIRVRVREMK